MRKLNAKKFVIGGQNEKEAIFSRNAQHGAGIKSFASGVFHANRPHFWRKQENR
jgi:hypothetical protein